MRDTTLNSSLAASPSPWTQERILQVALIAPAFLLYSLNWLETVGLAVLILLFEFFILREMSSPPDAGELERESRMGAYLWPAAILVLALVFRHHLEVVAGAWALVAIGDVAAGVIGQSRGAHPLPFNSEKTWEGFAAFVLLGGAAALLLTLWVSGHGFGFKALWVCAGAAVAGAFAESLPIRLNDNVSVPLVAGGVLFCASLIESQNFDSNLPYLGVRVVLALVVSFVFALSAWRLRQITASGAAAGFVLSVAIYMAFGYKSFLVLLCFFVLGAATTRMGYARKLARGIAERRRGARSWREACANLLAAAFFAVLVITTPHQWAFLAAMVAALAEAAGDTVSSETGKWLASRAYLITTLQPVAAGENGGVSAAGTAAGAGALAIVVVVSWALGLCAGWMCAAVFGAAIVGNVADSLIGATIERRGLVTNGVVNFTGSALAGALALAITLR